MRVSIFSTIKKICTDGCILIPKINVFGKKLPCYEWEPLKFILAQVKSATYKNLHTRKKQQQQTAANEDPKD